MVIKDLLSHIHRGAAIKIAVLLLFLLIVEIVLTCYIPTWRSMLFDPIKDKNVDLFYHGVTIFVLGLSALGAVQGLKIYVSSLFAFELRSASSKGLFHRWSVADKPKQTGYIQPQTEAVRTTTEYMVSIIIEVFISLFIVVGLIVSNMNNPIILWGALAYSIIVSLLTVIFNRPMTTRNVAWQEAEGLYTEKLSELAGKRESFPLDNFVQVGAAYIKYQLMNMYFTLTSTGTGILSNLIPYILLSGAYFSGKMGFGEYMAGIATFDLIVINATILTTKYSSVIKTVASWKIIKEFHSDHLPKE